MDRPNFSKSSKDYFSDSYYAVLDLKPWASGVDIRRAYRELSKRYHPDTTQLEPKIATKKFQQLNEAYSTLSSPEKRALYDLEIGYSRLHVIAPLPNNQEKTKDSAYLDATDRPLSSGEIAVLLSLIVTIMLCLALVTLVGYFRSPSNPF